jgi:hypothetical protein
MAGRRAKRREAGKRAGYRSSSISGAPVPRAHVTMQSGNEGVRYGATSGADGRFAFTGVASGNYSVSAERVGFVNLQNGGSQRDRVTVTLKADDNKTGVDLALMPTGALRGRVTDADGEPGETPRYRRRAQEAAIPIPLTRTAGILLAGWRQANIRCRLHRKAITSAALAKSTDGTTEIHNAATYYPGVLTRKEAGKVDVRGGVETPGADIRLVHVPFVRVSGRAVDMPADAHPNIMITQGQGGTGPSMKRDGTFALWRLDPGKYTLSADWQAPNGEHLRTVGVPIQVAGSNIDNIELRVVPDSDISGQLEFEDDEAKQIPKYERRISLSGGGAFGEGQATATIDANGAVQLKKVAAGKYLVMVSWGSDYIRSVRLGSSPAKDLMVVLLPADGGADADSDDEVMGFGFQKSVGTAGDGTYSFDHVAPGTYRLVAVPENEMERSGNQVIGYEDQMETVTVRPKDKVTKDLKRRGPTSQWPQFAVGTFSA